MENTSYGKMPEVGPIPEWEGLTDQSRPAIMAEFISSFPVAMTITLDELIRINREAAICTYPSFESGFPTFSVVLHPGGLAVDPAGGWNEWYYFVYGTHSVHGNFATFWSVRGPGPQDGPHAFPRPRPCFLFCDRADVVGPTHFDAKAA